MLCINTNGNETIPRAAENTIANNRANTPIKNPSIANNIFMQITQMMPSISQENIKPGNLIDNPAHQRKTSPIYEPEMMQYSIAKIPYPIRTENNTPNPGLTLSILARKIAKAIANATTPPAIPHPKDSFFALLALADLARASASALSFFDCSRQFLW